MRATRLLLATAAALALALPAANAQQQQNGTYGTQPRAAVAPAKDETRLVGGLEMRVNDDGALVIQPFAITADELEDGELYGANGEEIGEIESVLVDASGKPVAVAVEAGGFLGLGEKKVVIRLDQLRLKGDNDLTTTLSRQQVEQLPAWED